MRRSALVQLVVFALAAIVAAPVCYVLKLSVAMAGCDWRDAQEGYFMGLCGDEEFGDYEHGAYYFNLEPNATRHLARAKVIFLGNSRAQFAFSTEAVRSFFELHPVPYYLIGFPGGKSEFPSLLLRKYRPPIRSIVVNTDPFFYPALGRAKPVVTGSLKTYWAYVAKKIAAPIQQSVCGILPALCAPPLVSIYRSEATGAWYTRGVVQKTLRREHTKARRREFEMSDKELVANAHAFLKEFAIRPECAVFTSSPNSRFNGAPIAVMLAQSLGAHAILPDLPGIFTLDGSHLDQPSAERWSAAFLEQYAPIMERCLNRAPPTESEQNSRVKAPLR
jgi:hypothetical protein